MPLWIKIIVSVVVILCVTEAVKRFGVWGSLLAALPVVSLLSMVWIYLDTRDTARISQFSLQVFWFVIPSLGMFAALPWFLGRFSFFASLGLGCLVAVGIFAVMLVVFHLCGYDPFG